MKNSLVLVLPSRVAGTFSAWPRRRPRGAFPVEVGAVSSFTHAQPPPADWDQHFQGKVRMKPDLAAVTFNFNQLVALE